MGAIGGMLGTAGGAGGTGFKAPQQAPVINPTTPEGVAAAQAGASGALNGSAGLLAALQAQNGATQQSSVLSQGQGLAGQLAGNNGAGIEGAAAGQQAGLNAGLGTLNGAGTIGAATAQQGALNAGLTGMNSAGLMSGAATGQGDLNAQLAGLGGAGAVAGAIGQQGALAGQLGGAGGVGAQTSAIGGLQNVLAQQQAVANGTGPNPAQAMLNQATGQNVANQAALMAGQRGAGANVGLMARQAAQQGAGIQQNAAGQAATMQANQQLNALGAMGQTNQALAGVGAGLTGQQQAAIGQQGAMGSNALNQLQTGLGQQFGQGATGAGLLQTGIGQLNAQGLGAVGAQQTGINSLAGQGGAMVGQQTAQLGQNAGMAQNMVGNQIGATGQNVQGNLTNAGQQLGAVQGVNNAAVGAQSSVNAGNTALAGGAQKQQGDLIGGAMNGAGSAAMLAAAARGGEVHMAEGGGPVVGVAAPMVQAPTAAPVSPFGQFLSGLAPAQEGDSALKTGSTNFGKGMGQLAASSMRSAPAGDSAGGDMADVGSIAATAARGGGVVKADAPGEKATKAGNSYANDKIPAMLSEGEVVIPRSVMNSPDPASAAAKFVSALRARGGGKLQGGANPVEPGAPLDAESPAPAVDTPAAAPVPEAAPAAPAAPAADPNAPIDVIGHDLDNQDALVGQDIARGQIHPETMQSLYGKKDTLGKIGTLFGLLVSGAGSGLAHQPNAVLEMMNNQIKNDLEAQKDSNTNAQNWLRLTQAHQMNKVNRKLIGAQTEQAKAGVAKTNADTELVASTSAQNWARLGAAGYLQNNIIAKMPPGPARDAAQQKLDTQVIPGILASNKENNAKANAVLKTRAAIHGAAASGDKPEPPPVDFDKLAHLEKQGRFAGDLGAGMPPQDIASARAEADTVVKNRQLYGTWKKAWTQLDNMALAGKLTSQTRNAVVTSLASQMAKQTGIPTNAEQMKLVDSMFPSAEDWAGARQAKIDYTTEHFKQMEGGTPTLTQYKLLRPFPAPPTVAKNKAGSVGGAISSIIDKGESAKGASGPKEGATGTHKGKPVIYKNGKWVPK